MASEVEVEKLRVIRMHLLQIAFSNYEEKERTCWIYICTGRLSRTDAGAFSYYIQRTPYVRTNIHERHEEKGCMKWVSHDSLSFTNQIARN